MPSLEEVKTALQSRADGINFLGRKEINELPSILWENELPEMAIQGFYKNGNGLLVCTNTRLIFIDKGLIKLTVEDFPLKNISSIQYETGIIFGKLTIFASGNRADITQVEKRFVRSFAEFVRAKISNPKQGTDTPKDEPAPSSSSSNAVNDDVVSQLERLASLKEKGILTDEEFATQKAKILGM